MESFVASHPFPTYDEMIRQIDDHPNMSESMAMYAEYGRPHHEALKAAYESGMDRTAIRRAGKIIYKLGGFQAMQMNYFAFMYFSPFQKAKHMDPELYYAYKEFEYGWDGIGKWRA